MGIENKNIKELKKIIAVDGNLTQKEKQAFLEAFRRDKKEIIKAAQQGKNELKDFIKKDFANRSYELVGQDGVKAFQKAQGLNPTGAYDTETFQAVTRFQSKKGLTIDGIIGSKTLLSMGKTVPVGKNEASLEPVSAKKKSFLEKIFGNNDSPKDISQDDANTPLSKSELREIKKQFKGKEGKELTKAIQLFQKIAGVPITGKIDRTLIEAIRQENKRGYDTPMTGKDIAKMNKNSEVGENIEGLNVPKKWKVIFKEFFLHARGSQEQKEILSGKYPIALTDTRTGTGVIIMGKKGPQEFPVSYGRNGKFVKGPSQGDNATNYGFVEHLTKGFPYKHGGMKIQVRESEGGSLKRWHCAEGDNANGLRNTIGCKGMPRNAAANLASYVNKAGKGFGYASRQ